MTTITYAKGPISFISPLVILSSIEEISDTISLSNEERVFLQLQWKKGIEIAELYTTSKHILAVRPQAAANESLLHEKYRRIGAQLCSKFNQQKITGVAIFTEDMPHAQLALTEGIAYTNYTFSKYKPSNSTSLTLLTLYCPKDLSSEVNELSILIDAVYKTRDLVNEPVLFLTAEQFSKEIETLGKDAGFSVEVFNKSKIQSLKMGGLLAVNAGSPNPPTFTILEYKHPAATSKNPIVLVGKGVVYDTGGLSLKPTEHSMDMMKCDMAGGAAVVGAFYAVAKMKLPVHIIGLIPATENRPDGNAITPGDIITMHDGTTVEILNTDAEGRLILADALSYAKKYQPELVIDLATLTGSAVRAIGKEGIVYMGTAEEQTKKTVEQVSESVFERVVEFPLWDDYATQIESDVADLKNIGGPEAGAITAGKFLQHFTDYPWLHLDIAGGAFMTSPFHYWPKGGTGLGVRLLYHYLKTKSN